MSRHNRRVECEFAVVGALLMDNSRVTEVDLDADDFCVSDYREIFDAINILVNEKKPADILTVAEHLDRSRFVADRSWLSVVGEIVNRTPSAANVVAYARIVKEEATRQRALTVAKNLELGLEEDGLESVDEAIKQLMMLSAPRKNFECTVQQAAAIAIDEIDAAYRSGGKATGVTTGLTDLDGCLGGLHNGDLNVIAARPSMGKTAALLNLADNSGVPVGIISGEQGRAQVGLRLIAKNGRLNAYRLRLGKLDDADWPRLTHSAHMLSNKHIWIYDRPNPTIEELMRQARKWKFQHGIKALYVDYIQRIRALPKSPRHEQVGYVALCLKELARELDIPVIALAQVNRSVEERENKRPSMSDIKNSGDIEQEADTIITLYREEVYSPDSYHDKGIAEWDIKKNRHGPTGMIRTVWLAESMTFENYADNHVRGVA